MQQLLLRVLLQVRSISGGQHKRVNVGLELVAEPSLHCCALLCLCLLVFRYAVTA
jgi:ABC-type multidrug transport system ATPase subunit